MAWALGARGGRGSPPALAASNADPALATPSQARPHWPLPQTLKQPRVRMQQRPLAGLAWAVRAVSTCQSCLHQVGCARLVQGGWTPHCGLCHRDCRLGTRMGRWGRKPWEEAGRGQGQGPARGPFVQLLAEYMTMLIAPQTR